MQAFLTRSLALPLEHDGMCRLARPCNRDRIPRVNKESDMKRAAAISGVLVMMAGAVFCVAVALLLPILTMGTAVQ